MQFWKQLRFSIFVLAFIAGLVLGYGQIKPPAAAAVLDESEITLDQAPQEASMQLLLSHIRNMAAVPHHVDSPGLQQTQAYLKAQILQMGFTYEEEKYSLSIEDIMVIDALRMENGGKDFHTTPESIRENGDLGTRQQMALNNIIVTVDAPQTEEAVLFVAHTDSVKKGPGAFDDIVSVAAMLEGLRQLQNLTPVRDMVLLFTDGEEQGLLGAAKYVEDHPDMQAKTRLVINLEARGNRGGLLMFETSDNNLELVRSFASSAHHPISLSLATAVYRSMKNDTDFSIFRTAGYPGLNFAVIEGVEVYHTADDNYQNFSRASANHYLQMVTSMARHYATIEDLELFAPEDAVFFPLTPGGLVVIPQSVSNILAVCATVSFVLYGFWLKYRKEIIFSAMLIDTAKQLLMMAIAAGFSMPITRIINEAQSMEDFLAMMRSGSDWLYFLVMLGVCCLVALWLYRRSSKTPLGSPSTSLGVLLIPAILSVATALLYPAASYLFWIPVLLSLLTLILKPIQKTGLPYGLFILITLLLYVPVINLAFIALGLINSYIVLAFAMMPLTLILGMYRPCNEVYNTDTSKTASDFITIPAEKQQA